MSTDRDRYRSGAKIDNLRERRAAKAEALQEETKKVSKKKASKKEAKDGE